MLSLAIIILLVFVIYQRLTPSYRRRWIHIVSAQELLGSAPSVQIWLISDNCRIRSDNAQHSVWLQDQVGGSAGRPRARESLFTELCSVEVPTKFRGSFNIIWRRCLLSLVPPLCLKIRTKHGESTWHQVACPPLALHWHPNFRWTHILFKCPFIHNSVLKERVRI